MLRRAALFWMTWLLQSNDHRCLCKFDCRFLEDIGLNPRDVLLHASPHYRLTAHHPSWDREKPIYKYCRLESIH